MGIMKHDHKKTKKLKVALFSMIMFLPFIAIGVTCATHIFNKEVTEETQSATINYKYELPTETSNNVEDYYNKLIKIGGYPTNDESAEIIYATDGINTYESTHTTYIDIQGGSAAISFADNTWIEFDINNLYIVPTYLYEDYYQNITIPQNNDYNPIESVNITTNPQDQTTNIFYDSCDQVQDSFILNWCTTGNPINSGVNAFTNAFNLPNGHIINTLITYWLCVAIIYIVIDIIVECIVTITHCFSKEV